MRSHSLLFAVCIVVTAPTLATAQGLEVGGARIELGAPKDSVLQALQNSRGIGLRKMCVEADGDCHNYRSTSVDVRCGNRGATVSTYEYQGRESFTVTEYVQE